MGAYAVEFITSSSQAQRGYYEVSVQISYRRTAEQIQAVVNATSTEALSSLLETALDNGETELAVRIGYWRTGDRERVAEIAAQLREERGLADTPPWGVYYYPAEETAGLIEFVLEGAELDAQPVPPATETPEPETAEEEISENLKTNT